MAKIRKLEVFPIKETIGEPKMRNIKPSALTHFYGLTTKDANTFMFGFVAVCRTYDYTTYVHKLKLIPSTLKDASLHWFMSLKGGSITS